MKALIRRYKFDADKKIAHVFAAMLHGWCRAEHIRPENTVFLYVPSSRRGLRHRGYNQIEEIFRLTGFKYSDAIYLNPGHKSRMQKTLDRERRMKESRDKYLLDMDCLGSLSGIDKIIVVDDIWTTGATMMNCIKLVAGYLSENNPGIAIEGLVMAKAESFLAY